MSVLNRLLHNTDALAGASKNTWKLSGLLISERNPHESRTFAIAAADKISFHGSAALTSKCLWIHVFPW